MVLGDIKTCLLIAYLSEIVVRINNACLLGRGWHGFEQGQSKLKSLFFLGLHRGRSSFEVCKDIHYKAKSDNNNDGKLTYARLKDNDMVANVKLTKLDGLIDKKIIIWDPLMMHMATYI